MDLKKPLNSLINKLASYLYKNIKHRGISLLFDYRRPRVHNDHKFLLWSTPTLLICPLHCSNITVSLYITVYHYITVSYCVICVKYLTKVIKNCGMFMHLYCILIWKMLYRRFYYHAYAIIMS